MLNTHKLLVYIPEVIKVSICIYVKAEAIH